MFHVKHFYCPEKGGVQDLSMRRPGPVSRTPARQGSPWEVGLPGPRSGRSMEKGKSIRPPAEQNRQEQKKVSRETSGQDGIVRTAPPI